MTVILQHLRGDKTCVVQKLQTEELSMCYISLEFLARMIRDDAQEVNRKNVLDHEEYGKQVQSSEKYLLS